MKNKRGNVAIELLVMLVIVLITSGIVLFLVQSGVIAVKAENEDVSLLNTEFLPYGREGYLALKEFSFCQNVDEQYQCISPHETFFVGDEVHFRFVVESTVYNGEIILVENYRLRGPSGELLLDVDEKSNFHYELKSNSERELVTIKDYFVMSEQLPIGTYSLELVLQNPLLDKKATSVKTFQLVKE